MSIKPLVKKKKMVSFSSVDAFSDAVEYDVNQVVLKEEFRNKSVDDVWENMLQTIYDNIFKVLTDYKYDQHILHKPIDETLEKFDNVLGQRLVHVKLLALPTLQYKYARDIAMKIRRLLKKSCSVMIIFVDEEGNPTRKTFSMGL